LKKEKDNKINCLSENPELSYQQQQKLNKTTAEELLIFQPCKCLQLTNIDFSLPILRMSTSQKEAEKKKRFRDNHKNHQRENEVFCLITFPVW